MRKLDTVSYMMMERLSQVIRDEPEVHREILGTVLEHLPTGQVAGETVHHRQVEFLG